MFGNEKDVAHNATTNPGLSIDVVLGGAISVRLLTSADERNDHSQRRSYENDKDRANMQSLVVVGNVGRVAIGELLGRTISMVVTDWLSVKLAQLNHSLDQVVTSQLTMNDAIRVVFA